MRLQTIHVELTLFARRKEPVQLLATCRSDWWSRLDPPGETLDALRFHLREEIKELIRVDRRQREWRESKEYKRLVARAREREREDPEEAPVR